MGRDAVGQCKTDKNESQCNRLSGLSGHSNLTLFEMPVEAKPVFESPGELVYLSSKPFQPLACPRRKGVDATARYTNLCS